MKKLSSILVMLSVLSVILLIDFSGAAGEKNAASPEIAFVGGYPLSSISGVLRNIADARSVIHDNKTADAEGRSRGR